MNTIPQIVATSNATADIAYYVCIVSFFIAGGVAIFLLWDKVQQHNKRSKKTARVVKPSAKKAPAKKAAAKAAPKKAVAKKAPAKKPVAKKAPTKRTTKKK